jgi:hypothetical protein
MVGSGRERGSRTGPAPRLREADVVALWRRAVLSRSDFNDLEGSRVSILYPGRPNDSRGADFKEALIRRNGQTYRGCIEIHTRVASWKEHSHQRDPAYNNVILHVAWERDTGEETRRQDGAAVPTIVLGEGAALRPSSVPPRICQMGPGRRGQSLRAVVGSLGDARLEVKAREFELQSKRVGPGQALYLGLMEALGYSRNREGFRHLGRLVPLKALEEGWSVMGSGAFSRQALEARLLGEAGFLRGPLMGPARERRYQRNLEKLWAESGQSGERLYPAWDVFKIRPANHPVRRIVALSHLLWHFRRRGLVDGMLEAVKGARGARSPADLESALMVAATPYWRAHFDLERISTRPLPHLLGQARAREIAVNVVLPFALARGGDLGEKAREIFAAYPRLESNSLERHLLLQLNLENNFAGTARLQQGLLHLYRAFCGEGQCALCPLA